MNMKNVPRKLDSKTTCLSIRVPENLDLVLEGLIRKVLREQPKKDDLYEFAAEYFEALLQIRDQAGIKKTADEICPGVVRDDENALELIKLANTFPKPSPDDRSTSPSRPGRCATLNLGRGRDAENKENEGESKTKKVGVARAEKMGSHIREKAGRHGKSVMGDVKDGKSTTRNDRISRETGVALRDETNLPNIVNKTSSYAMKMPKLKQKKTRQNLQEKDLIKEMVEREIDERGGEKLMNEAAERQKTSDDTVLGTSESREKKTESKNERPNDENDRKKEGEEILLESNADANESKAKNEAKGSKSENNEDKDEDEGDESKLLDPPKREHEVTVKEEIEGKEQKHSEVESDEFSAGGTNEPNGDVIDTEKEDVTTVDESEITEDKDADDTLADAKDIDSKTEEGKAEDKSDAAEDLTNFDSDNNEHMAQKTTEEEVTLAADDRDSPTMIDEKETNGKETGSRSGEENVKAEEEEKKKTPVVPGIPVDGKLGGGKVRKSFQEARNAAKKPERFGRKTSRKEKSEEKLDGLRTPGDVPDTRVRKEPMSSGRVGSKDKPEPGRWDVNGRRDRGTERDGSRRRRGTNADKKPEEQGDDKSSERFRKRTPFDQSKAKVDPKERTLQSRSKVKHDSKKVADSDGNVMTGAVVPAVLDVVKGRENESSVSSSNKCANDQIEEVKVGGEEKDSAKAIGGISPTPMGNPETAHEENDAMEKESEFATEPEVERKKLQDENADDVGIEPAEKERTLKTDEEAGEAQNQGGVEPEPRTEEKAIADRGAENECERPGETENLDSTEYPNVEECEESEATAPGTEEKVMNENLSATSKGEVEGEGPAGKTSALPSDEGGDATANDEIKRENPIDTQEGEAPTEESSLIETGEESKDDDILANPTPTQIENSEEDKSSKKELECDVIETSSPSEPNGDSVEAAEKLEENSDAVETADEVRGKEEDFIITDEIGSPKQDLLIVDDEKHEPKITEERTGTEESEPARETQEDEEDVGDRVGSEEKVTTEARGDGEPSEKENDSAAGIGSKEERGGEKVELVDEAEAISLSEKEPSDVAMAPDENGGNTEKTKVSRLLTNEENDFIKKEEKERTPAPQGEQTQVDEPDCVKVSVKPIGTAAVIDGVEDVSSEKLSNATETTNSLESTEPERGEKLDEKGRNEEKDKVRDVDEPTEKSKEEMVEARGKDSLEPTVDSVEESEKAEETTPMVQPGSPGGRHPSDPTRNLTVNTGTENSDENADVNRRSETKSMATAETLKAAKDDERKTNPSKTFEGHEDGTDGHEACRDADNGTEKVDKTKSETDPEEKVDDDNVPKPDTAAEEAQSEVGTAREAEKTRSVESTNVKIAKGENETKIQRLKNEVNLLETAAMTTTIKKVREKVTEEESVSADNVDAPLLEDSSEVDPETGGKILSEVAKAEENFQGESMPEENEEENEVVDRMRAQADTALEENASNRRAQVEGKHEEKKKSLKMEVEEAPAETDPEIGQSETGEVSEETKTEQIQSGARNVEKTAGESMDDRVTPIDKGSNEKDKAEEVDDEFEIMSAPSKEETAGKSRKDFDDLKPGDELWEKETGQSRAGTAQTEMNDSSDRDAPEKRSEEGDEALSATEETRDATETPAKETGEETTSGGTAADSSDERIMVSEEKTKNALKEAEMLTPEHEDVCPAATATDPNKTAGNDLKKGSGDASGNGDPVLGDVFTKLKTPRPGEGDRVFNQVKDEVESLRKALDHPRNDSSHGMDTGGGSDEVTGEPGEADEDSKKTPESEEATAQNEVLNLTGVEVGKQISNETTTECEEGVQPPAVTVKNTAEPGSLAKKMGTSAAEGGDIGEEVKDHVWKPKSIKEDGEDFIYVEEASSEPDKIHHQEFLDDLVIGGKFPKTPSQEREDETTGGTASEVSMHHPQPDVAHEGSEVETEKNNVVDTEVEEVDRISTESGTETAGVDIKQPTNAGVNVRVSEEASEKPQMLKRKVAKEGAKILGKNAADDKEGTQVKAEGAGAETRDGTERTGDTEPSDADASECRQREGSAELNSTVAASQLVISEEAPTRDEKTQEPDVTETADTTEEDQKIVDEPSERELNVTDVVVTVDDREKTEDEPADGKEEAVVEECSVTNAQTPEVNDESNLRVLEKGMNFEKSSVERLPQWVPIDGGLNLSKPKEENSRLEKTLDQLSVRDSSRKNTGNETQPKEEEKPESKIEGRTEEEGAEAGDEVKPPDVEVTEDVDEELPEEKDESVIARKNASPETAPKTGEDDVDEEDDSQSGQGTKIKKIIPHYFDLLAVPEIVTKKYQVHFMKENSPVTSSISESGTVIRAYQFDKDDRETWTVVKEVVSRSGAEEPESQRSEFDDLVTPSSGYSILVSDMSLLTVSEAFLSAERRYSSMELEERERSDRGISDLDNDVDREQVHQVEVEAPSESGEAFKETPIIKVVRTISISPRNELQEKSEQTGEAIADEKSKNDVSSLEVINSHSSSRESSKGGGSFDEDVGFRSVDIETVIQNEVVDDNDDDSDVIDHMASRVTGLSNASEKGEQEFGASEQDDNGTGGIHSGRSVESKGSSEEVESEFAGVATKVGKIESERLQRLIISSEETVERKRSVFTQGSRGSDTEVWSFLEREISAAATKIQTTFRGFRNRLQRDNAIQISTEESSSETASAEHGLQGTGEFHDTIVPHNHRQ